MQVPVVYSHGSPPNHTASLMLDVLVLLFDPLGHVVFDHVAVTGQSSPLGEPTG